MVSMMTARNTHAFIRNCQVRSVVSNGSDDAPAWDGTTNSSSAILKHLARLRVLGRTLEQFASVHEGERERIELINDQARTTRT